MFKLKSFFYALTLICFVYCYAFATDHYEINGSSTVVGQVYSNFKQSGYGGVFAVSSSGTLTILTTNETKFENNSATGTGGAISNEEGKITIGDNVSFILNTSGSAGGAIYSDSIDFAPEIEIGNNVVFSSNTSNLDGGAIDNYGSLKIGANAIFSYNKVIGNSGNYYGGAISNNRNAFNHEIKGNIEIGANVIFEGNVSNAYGGAISNGSDSTLTIKDGALFKNNSARSGGAIYTKGTVNLIANTNDILFDGNTDDNGSCAICADDDGIGAGKINLFASKDAKITFNDKIRSVFPTSELNINKSGTLSDASGTIILNEDMSGFSGDVNIYAGTVKLTENGKWFAGSTTIDNATIDIANTVIEDIAFNNLTVTNNLNLAVDADLQNEKMDTISTDGYDIEGTIKVTAINVISDMTKDKVDLEFIKTDVIKDNVESIDSASSDLYKYKVSYDTSTGTMSFFEKTRVANPLTHEAAVLGLIGGSFTKIATINQAFVGMDTRAKSKKQNSAQTSKLYASASNQVFKGDSEIQRGVWVRPYASNETLSLSGMSKDIDTTIYGTLAGIDLPVAEDKMVSVYFGYNASNQKFSDIKINNNGYYLGVTGMLVKENYYIGATVNADITKSSSETDFGTDDVDMTSYAVAAKAGYNFEVGNNWIIEPNLMVAYIGINTKDYTNTQGYKVNAEDINNVHIEPGVKASLELNNGWTPYGLISASFNFGEAAAEVNGKSIKALSMDPYYECGIGVTKDFLETPWSFYGEIDGRTGSRQGVGLNFGVKYSF